VLKNLSQNFLTSCGHCQAWRSCFEKLTRAAPSNKSLAADGGRQSEWVRTLSCWTARVNFVKPGGSAWNSSNSSPVRMRNRNPEVDSVWCHPQRPESNAVFETEVFCHWYLKINNSAVKQYFWTKFCGSFTDIFSISCYLLRVVNWLTKRQFSFNAWLLIND